MNPMHVLRTLRGIVRTALIWAVVWAPLSLIPIALSMLSPPPLTLRVIEVILVWQASVGAINGAVFASVVAAVGRRKTFESVSLPWIAACGAVGGVVFPGVVRAALLSTGGISIPATSLFFLFGVNAILGAGLAAGSLAIARRAPALSQRDAAIARSIPAGAA